MQDRQLTLWHAQTNMFAALGTSRRFERFPQAAAAADPQGPR